MSRRARLRALLVERSLERGEFTLASGATSSYYVDARKTTMSAEGLFLVGAVALERIRREGLDPSHVGGLTMGADPVAFAIARASWDEGSPVDAFSVRKTAKEHGLRRRIEGGLPPGARALVVEDATTTGGSALSAIEAVEEHGATVLAVLTVVDREEGARERLESAGHPLLALFTGRELQEAAEED